MRRLVVVSNRVGPIRGAAAGGLSAGLLDALRERRGLWFGWSGRTQANGSLRHESRVINGLTVSTLDLGQEDFDDYYNGYANRCLWPLFHFRIDLIRYRRRYLDAYRRVNAQFAKVLLPLLRPNDLVWVQDYHLFPLASELRMRGATQKLGFFLHIPFPPADMLNALPGHEWLLRSLFDYDLVGLQTAQDLRRFHDYILREANGSVRNGRVRAFDRELQVRDFPIGIDVENYRQLAFSTHGEHEFQRMRRSLNGRLQIICVDRLDYSKGLLRRMTAYEMLLEQHPEFHGRIELLQVAPLSRSEVRAYRDFRLELESAAAHLNGRYARFDWTPVHYLNRVVPRKTLAGLYRASRVALVTPVRDGMNLVAKEYVAAQDPRDPGVLVLSRFAGAAQQMTSALQINPYDPEGVSDAILQALSMGLEERRERHALLLSGLKSHDASHWCTDFCLALGKLSGRRIGRPRAQPQTGTEICAGENLSREVCAPAVRARRA